MSRQDSAVNNSKCVVCGISSQEVKVSLHYGAISCQACSLFFRRQSSKPVKEACISLYGNCQDDSGKTTCKHCRFQTCIQKGMKLDLINSKKRASSPKGKTRRKEKSEHLDQSEKPNKTDAAKDSTCEPNLMEVSCQPEAQCEPDVLGHHRPQYEPEVLGYFITIPGKEPRWISLVSASQRSSGLTFVDTSRLLGRGSRPPFTGAHALAQQISTELRTTVRFDDGEPFPNLVNMNVTSPQAKTVISQSIRKLIALKRKAREGRDKLHRNPVSSPKNGSRVNKEPDCKSHEHPNNVTSDGDKSARWLHPEGAPKASQLPKGKKVTDNMPAEGGATDIGKLNSGPCQSRRPGPPEGREPQEWRSAPAVTNFDLTPVGVSGAPAAIPHDRHSVTRGMAAAGDEDLRHSIICRAGASLPQLQPDQVNNILAGELDQAGWHARKEEWDLDQVEMTHDFNPKRDHSQKLMAHGLHQHGFELEENATREASSENYDYRQCDDAAELDGKAHSPTASGVDQRWNAQSGGAGLSHCAGDAAPRWISETRTPTEGCPSLHLGQSQPATWKYEENVDSLSVAKKQLNFSQF